MLKFNYDEWEQPKEPSDASERIVRPADRWTREEDEARYSRRGIPMRDYEYADFVTRGGQIDYCEKRAAKQRLNDQRYDERTEHNKLLMDIVTDVVATWSPASYLGRHRAIVREILGKPYNQRRRKLSGMSTMQRRHQEAIRLVHALAFDGISQAEYCQCHKLDPADASRMLDHLYEKEPGLADAIGAISACAATTSWQNRQQKQKLRDKREGRVLVFGFDYSEVPDHGGWINLAGLSAGCVKSYRTGKADSIAVWDDIPLSRFRTVSANRVERIHLPQYLDRPKTWRVASKPFDLHEPATWYASDCLSIPRTQRLPLHYWNALHEPMRVVQRLIRPLDRYRPINRKVNVKGRGQEVWRIGRTLDDSQPKHTPMRDGILAAWLRWTSQTKVLGDPYLPPRSRHGIFHSRLMTDVVKKIA